MHPHAHPVHLSERFTHVVASGNTLVLVGDEDSLLLELRAATDVLRLVDGMNTARDIAEELGPSHGREMVYFALLALEKEGIVREHPPGLADEQTPTLDDRERALRDRLRAAWERRGAARAVRVELAEADLDLILTDDYLEPSLAGVANGREARIEMLTRVGPHRIYVGPWLTPGKTACVACLQERLRLNLSARALVHSGGHEAEDVTVRALRSRVPDRAYGLAAQWILDSLGGAGMKQEMPGILAADPKGDFSWHPVHRLPHCPVCGDPSLREPGADIRLEARPRTPGSAGGYRSVTPTQTHELYGNLVSPLTGVVRRIGKVPVDSTDLVHVYSASHARRGGPANLKAVRDDLREHSGGKGRTDLEARVSALCESLERFSSIHRGTEPVRLAPLSEVEGASYAPNQLLLFSASQFESRESWNAHQAGHFQLIPLPYAGQHIEWSELRSLTTGEIRLVPSAFVFFGFRGEGSRFCKADSNGLAGGNCLEEAVLQGFLELAERDAIGIWWYNRLSRPGLDLASVQDPWVGRLREFYASIGRTLWVLDLTTDLDIACFAAVSARRDRVPEEPIFGFGAHLDPAIALSRALTEMNQMLPTILRSDRERRRQLLPDFADAIAWWQSARLGEHPYLLPDVDADPRPLSRYRPPDTGDLREDIEHCLQLAAAVGCEVLVYDLTRPDVGFAVAKVVVPGLRHMWRRLGPGRLYDVPVELGWSNTPSPEDDLNPVSLFV